MYCSYRFRYCWIKWRRFYLLISQGDYVKAGEPIVQFDNQFIKDKGYNLTTMVVFPSGYEKDFNLGEREVKKGEVLF